MDTKELFLSCDWGTSSFRLRLITMPELRVVAEVHDNRGIAATYGLWNEHGGNTGERFAFYQHIIKENIDKLQQQTQISLPGIPLIISGMASANIGMIDLPYKRLPFFLDGSDLVTHALPASDSFLHDTIIVSGARSDDDVMRGEEVQLLGSISTSTGKQLFIFPGTHSKHILTDGDRAIALQTYMTGEMFHLLSTKSILASSIEEGGFIQSESILQAFQKGVAESGGLNPLHAFFLIRTNQLFNTMSKKENYFYLSGLLIGLELSELRRTDKVTLVSDSKFSSLYRTALDASGIHILQELDVNETVIKGHYRVLHLTRLKTE
jgi:2-dehydro-3-deoxygalactonokinase